MDTFWEAFAPTLAIILGTLLSGLVAWGLAILNRYTGIKIEEKHMNALHSAIMTGTQAAVAKLGPGAAIPAIAKEAEAYVRQSVPDAIKKLNPPDNVLADLVIAGVERVINPTILIGDAAKAITQGIRR